LQPPKPERKIDTKSKSEINAFESSGHTRYISRAALSRIPSRGSARFTIAAFTRRAALHRLGRNASSPTHPLIRSLMNAARRMRLAATLPCPNDHLGTLCPAQPHRPACRRWLGVVDNGLIHDSGVSAGHNLASRSYHVQRRAARQRTGGFPCDVNLFWTYTYESPLLASYR
jgi:hypothetical protein